jgi:4-hydroxythreonine-4-phosphate dehydrogenase
MEYSPQRPAVALRPPRLAVTLGDPAGIGPEVILKAFLDSDLTQSCEITLVGSYASLAVTYKRLQQERAIGREGLERWLQDQHVALLEVPLTPMDLQLGSPSPASGAASFAYLDRAIALTLAGQFDAIVTGPIAKSAWQAAGHDYPGQTERLAEQAGVSRSGMLFVATSPHSGWTLRTLLATTHIPLAQVTTTLTPALLSTKLDLLVTSLQQDFGLPAPRIAIAGLNPHSGEQGQLGREEQDWLIPWVMAQRARYPHLQLEGPIPPDTLWVRPGQAWFTSQEPGSASPQGHDAYLALYHDQGLIPTKLLAFDRAVNTTLGLPFVRTSPDHGTAFDIAGRGLADATSMKAALRLAMQLVKGRYALAQP